jgi:DNA-binding GntR family transcriptional regulator
MPRLAKTSATFDARAAFAGVTVDRSRAIGPQIYGVLRRLIIRGKLPPGTPVQEKTIADLCAISRTPLREALQQLAQERLVRTFPQVGSIVAPIDRDMIEQAVVVRRALEGEVVRLVARRGLDENLLAPVMDEQRRAVEADDPDRFFDADEAMHELLATMAGTPTAWRLVQSVKAHVDRARLIMGRASSRRFATAWREHLIILDAVRRRDPAAARRLMSRHVESVLVGLDELDELAA